MTKKPKWISWLKTYTHLSIRSLDLRQMYNRWVLGSHSSPAKELSVNSTRRIRPSTSNSVTQQPNTITQQHNTVTR